MLTELCASTTQPLARQVPCSNRAPRARLVREDARVKQSAEGDFRGWVSARRPRLRKTAFLLCGDWFLADDLVQDACTRMYSVWDRVAASGTPDGYARRVIVNLYLDHRRRPSRREEPVELLPDSLAVDSDDDVNGDRVIDALGDLAPGQRAVLVLRFWEDLMIDEAASVLGTSVGNVKSQSSRGLAALRAALEARGMNSLADTVRESS